MRTAFKFLLCSVVLLVSCSSCEVDWTTGDIPGEVDENTNPTTPPTSSADETMALRVLDLVNDQRAQGCRCGNDYYPPVSPLRLNSHLMNAARLHSADMADRRRMEHQGSDGSSVGDRATAAGYRWNRIGENIAWNQRSASEVFNGWINSPGHCRNIMQSAFTDMGLAVDDWYWTQVLGRSFD